MNDNLDMRENPTHTCKKLTFVTNIFVVNTRPQYGHHGFENRTSRNHLITINP